MHPLTLECYLKPEGAEKSLPAGQVRFSVKPVDHRRMEEEEEKLQESGKPEVIYAIDPAELSLELPPEVDALEDCKIRVYMREYDGRAQFHIFGHRRGDRSLFYTNAVMVDSVGA